MQDISYSKSARRSRREKWKRKTDNLDLSLPEPAQPEHDRIFVPPMQPCFGLGSAVLANEGRMLPLEVVWRVERVRRRSVFGSAIFRGYVS